MLSQRCPGAGLRPSIATIAQAKSTMHNNHFYIAVEGAIGVGKTTLARILREELGGQLLNFLSGR